MPIRFRCVYCNQLMGIARRKAGTVVRCPNCTGQVIVPRPDSSAPDAPAEAKPAQPGRSPFFDQVDMDEALGSGNQRTAMSSDPESAAHPLPIGPPSDEPADDETRFEFPTSIPVHGAPAGIFLSPLRATIISVAFVIALALAFTAGLFVGRYLNAPNNADKNAASAPA